MHLTYPIITMNALLEYFTKPFDCSNSAQIYSLIPNLEHISVVISLVGHKVYVLISSYIGTGNSGLSVVYIIQKYIYTILDLEMGIAANEDFY